MIPNISAKFDDIAYGKKRKKVSSTFRFERNIKSRSFERRKIETAVPSLFQDPDGHRYATSTRNFKTQLRHGKTSFRQQQEKGSRCPRIHPAGMTLHARDRFFHGVLSFLSCLNSAIGAGVQRASACSSPILPALGRPSQNDGIKKRQPKRPNLHAARRALTSAYTNQAPRIKTPES
jgi:hypothetical protein